MDVDQQIRLLAARGESKSEVMRILGISRYKMDLLCEAMPDLRWRSRGQTNGCRRKYDAVRGTFPAHLRKNLSAATQARQEALRIYEICGVRGSVTELYALWKEHISVGRQMVSRRLKEGMSVYDAFFLPKLASGVDMSASRRRAFLRARQLGLDYQSLPELRSGAGVI